ncbi:Saccharopine dehydrogenase [Trapelia coarctata]|nr:Saccharopine dehydrogenase [Trapelia coarctata]
MSRFPAGSGTLLDLEFLTENGRRIAASDITLAMPEPPLQSWTGPGDSIPPIVALLCPLNYYPNETALVSDVKASMQKGFKYASSPPQDMAETAKGGPFKEIIESDIFINCIYLDKPIPKFVNRQSLSSPDRKLSVVCDVGCDTTNPHDHIPIYDICTTFDNPTVPVEVERDPPLSVISIDHLHRYSQERRAKHLALRCYRVCCN